MMHLEGRQRNCGLNDRHGSLNQPDLQCDHTLIAGRVRIDRCLEILARGPSRRSMRESLRLTPSAHEGPSFRYGHSSSAVAGVSLLRSGRIATELEGADSHHSVLQSLRSDELPVLCSGNAPTARIPTWPWALTAQTYLAVERIMALTCQQSGVLEVVRRAPEITAAGKVLPMLRAAGRREGESGRGEPI